MHLLVGYLGWVHSQRSPITKNLTNLSYVDAKRIAGQSVNLEKTEIIPLEANRANTVNLQGNSKKIKYNTGPFKTFGIWFSNKLKDKIDLNYTQRIEKVKTLLQIWLGRCLSLKGNITILQTLIIPQIAFLFAALYAPTHILKKLTISCYLFFGATKGQR